MIKLLDHTRKYIAKEIYRVFQVSYPYEAKLLGVTSFPPLNRTIIDFQKSTTLFYGYYELEELAAVMEFETTDCVSLRGVVSNCVFTAAS